MARDGCSCPSPFKIRSRTKIRDSRTAICAPFARNYFYLPGTVVAILYPCIQQHYHCQSPGMESQLDETIEACTSRFGELALGKKIASNVGDLLMNDTIQRIQQATTGIPVWKDLEEYIDNERVGEAAFEKIDLLMQQTDGDAASVLEGGSVDTIVTVMTSNEANESIQVFGVLILEVFAYDEANLSLLTPVRCINAIFDAMKRFPDSIEVQENAFGLLTCIQTRSHEKGEQISSLYSKFIAADALSLSLAALQNHWHNYYTISSALLVFRGCCGIGIVDNSEENSRAVSTFVETHPELRQAVLGAIAYHRVGRRLDYHFNLAAQNTISVLGFDE